MPGSWPSAGGAQLNKPGSAPAPTPASSLGRLPRPTTSWEVGRRCGRATTSSSFIGWPGSVTGPSPSSRWASPPPSHSDTEDVSKLCIAPDSFQLGICKHALPPAARGPPPVDPRGRAFTFGPLARAPCGRPCSLADTQIAKEVLGIEPPNTTAALPLSWAPADLIGQGTWRINQDRARWAIWSNPVVSEDVWLLTLAPIKKEKTLTENAMLIFKPFTLEVQVQNNSVL